MFRMLPSVALLGAFCWSVCAAAQTPDLTATTSAGREVVVWKAWRCSGGRGGDSVPSISVSQPPKNGSVEVRPGMVAVDHQQTTCMADQVQGALVVYIPRPGFAGTDRFAFIQHVTHRRKNIDEAHVTQVTVQ